MARAAVLLTALTAVSQVLGFVRDVVIAAVFGAGAALDAYLVAQGVTNLLLALVAGAMARALVPPVSRAVARGDSEAASRIVQVVLTATLLLLVTGAVVMYVAADVVVAVLAPGFDSATRALAVELARIVLLATVFVAATDILAAAAQSHGRFFASGLQGVPFNMVMIAAAAYFGAEYGITALAWGFVVGSAARMLLQLLPVRAISLRLRPRLNRHDPGVREALRLAPALLVTMAAVNVNTLVDRAVGSAQGEGVVAALSFGWRVVTLVDTLLVVTLVAAIYPALGAAGAADRREQLRALVTRAMRTALTLLVPVVAFLVLVADPLVDVLFGRGAFDAQAVRLTAVAVTAYAASAALLALRTLGTRTCLAVGDTRTPVLVALLVMVVNVVGDLTLGVRYGVGGIAASTSLALGAGAVAVIAGLHRRHRGVDLSALGATAGRVSLATGAGVACCLLLDLPARVVAASDLATVAALVATGAVLLAGYLLTMLALRGGEVAELRESLMRRRSP